ncbi:MAG: DNA gyrase inhibitor YacG [Alphaproteobacteria bacterium]|nr:DNA gyrase inhibitor YacG [Alphaproteobacteria bacterium]
MASTQTKTCPLCGKPADEAAHPFCSTRCAQIDLGRWLNESYVIETPVEEETPKEPPAN